MRTKRTNILFVLILVLAMLIGILVVRACSGRPVPVLPTLTATRMEPVATATKLATATRLENTATATLMATSTKPLPEPTKTKLPIATNTKLPPIATLYPTQTAVQPARNYRWTNCWGETMNYPRYRWHPCSWPTERRGK